MVGVDEECRGWEFGNLSYYGSVGFVCLSGSGVSELVVEFCCYLLMREYGFVLERDGLIGLDWRRCIVERFYEGPVFG